MLYFCLPVTFSFLVSGYSRKYSIRSADRHLVTRKRSVFALQTKNILVIVNCAVRLHFQSTHFHLFNRWFYRTVLCLLGSQWTNCGVCRSAVCRSACLSVCLSESFNHETELLLSKPVRRWRCLNHMIYCSYITFINKLTNKQTLYAAQSTR
jgi:hypothetical protein